MKTSSIERLEKRWLTIGLIGLFLAAIFSSGWHHFDEHFQILEFANLKLGGNTIAEMPWEYEEQMRPALQPLLAFLAIKALCNLNLFDPFATAFILRLLSAGFSAFVLYQIYRYFKPQIINDFALRVFIPLSFGLWFMVYNAVRFSSENWALLYFFIGFLGIMKNKTAKLFPALIFGSCLGLSFLFRYQSSILILGLGAHLLFIQKRSWKELLALFTGIISMILVGIIVDYWFYGEWVLSTWNYIVENLVHDRAIYSGEEPWYWYFSQGIVQGIPPLSILISSSILAYFFFRPKSVVTWMVLPFVLIHIVLAHKEIRFFYSVVPFMPFMLAKTIDHLHEQKNKWIKNAWIKIVWRISLIANVIFLLVIAVKPAESHISLYKALYYDYEGATLYYSCTDPYQRVRNIFFYRPNGLNTVQYHDHSKLPPSSTGKNLIAFTNKEVPEVIPDNYTLIYQSFPEWMKLFNFNNWMKRRRSWHVYEIE